MKASIRIGFKEFLASVFNVLFSGPAREGAILMYHSVGESQRFSTVTCKNFEQQLISLKESERSVVPLSVMISRLKAGESLEGYVSLTFDDGYRDFYTNVFPLLKKYKVHATVFIIAGSIGASMKTSRGEEFDLVTEAEIEEMVGSGFVDVMPHSMTHVRLNSVSLSDAVQEVKGSKERIESITGRPASIFAYPFGAYTEELAEALTKSGLVSAAVTVHPGSVNAQSKLMLLPRISVDSETKAQQFRMKISQGLRWYHYVKMV